MRSLPSGGGAPRPHALRGPSRRLPVLVIVLVLVAGVAMPALANHGGREIGSFLSCDRPVQPPRCTSVGDDFWHYVAFDASLSEGLASSLRDTMAEDYDGPTRLHLVEVAEVDDRTDVIAFSGDFGENGAAGWVYCPPDAPQGVNPRGDRWCRHQELYFNLNPRYSIFFDDDGSRDHVACHELGHTLGLHHWGNPPETDGPVGATCMNANTPNGPTFLAAEDVEHINAYRYDFYPTPRGVEVVRAPSLDGAMASGMIEATGVPAPRTLGQLVAGSDVVLVGRITDVEPGRAFGPPGRQLTYAAVSVGVTRLVGGSLLDGTTLVVEVPLFDGPASIDRLRDGLVGSTRLLFLRNKGESARAAGMSAEAIEADAPFHRLAAPGAELLVEGSTLRTLDGGAELLDRFDGRSLADVVGALRAVRSHP
ncbi:MAG TPA: hypothetical protein VHR55_13160 [Candidatus Limnocylindria bacterium]|nr:hypothetical protein [Candidatus Limnocylindria bacterium]